MFETYIPDAWFDEPRPDDDDDGCMGRGTSCPCIDCENALQELIARGEDPFSLMEAGLLPDVRLRVTTGGLLPF